MTPEKFKEEIERIDKWAARQKSKIKIRFAMETHTYKKGDVLTDHYHTIRVEKVISYYQAHYAELPACVFEGVPLNKDGSVSKRGDSRMYQENIVKVNGVDIK